CRAQFRPVPAGRHRTGGAHSFRSRYESSRACVAPRLAGGCASVVLSLLRCGHVDIPEFLDLVVGTCHGLQDVDDDAVEIDQHPLRLFQPFDAWLQAGRASLFGDTVGDALDMACGTATADDMVSAVVGSLLTASLMKGLSLNLSVALWG